MTTHEKISPFDPDTETWTSYFQLNTAECQFCRKIRDTQKTYCLHVPNLGENKEAVLSIRKRTIGHRIGVKRFYQYLFGNHFTLYSDHKPIEHLLNESDPIPQMASSQIQ